MELHELFSIIQRVLSQEGFTLTPHFQNSMKDSFFVKEPSDLWKVPVEGYNFTHLSGACLEVRQVYHSNGADHDASYRLEVVSWKNSSGTTVDKLKLTAKQTEKTIEKKIKNFLKNFYQNRLQIINTVI